MRQVQTNLASPPIGQGRMQLLQREPTSEADLAQEDKGGKPQAQQTVGLVMRSAPPEEIQKIFQHNLISDSTLTLPHIQRCLKDMMQEIGIAEADAPTSGATPVPIRLWFTAPELGHPLIDDNHDSPFHPLVGSFAGGLGTEPAAWTQIRYL